MHKIKTLKVYCCAECAEVEVKTTVPKIKGCKKSSLHRWIYLGEKGLEKYVCKGCGAKVNIIGLPPESPCPGAKIHQWEKI